MFECNAREVPVYNNRPQKRRAVPSRYCSPAPGFPSRIRCRSAAPAVKLADLYGKY